MKFLSSIFFILLAVIFSCSEEEPSQNNNPPNLEPAITSVGTPAGDPITKTIGPTGGSVASLDGRLQLSIPPDALSADTNITIQPVTNESPGGIGLAYDLLPDGTTFNKPATLTFHYKDEDVNGSLPEFLSIAHQNSDGAWVSDIQNQMLDTNAQTISLDVNHFTPFRIGTDFARIIAEPFILKPGEVSLLGVTETFVFEQSGEETRTEYSPVPANLVSNWSAAPAVGSLNTYPGDGAFATYRAPASVDTRQTVRISAHVNVNIVTYINRRRVEFRGVDLSTDIVLEPIPPRKYEITIEHYDSLISPFYGNKEIAVPGYYDEAKFELEFRFVNNVAEVSVSPIDNQAPTVTPASKEYRGTSFVWIPDSVGKINIKHVQMTSIAVTPESTVLFLLKHKNGSYPGRIWQTGEAMDVLQPLPFSIQDYGFPEYFTLDLKKSEPHYDPNYYPHRFKGGLHTYVHIAPKQ